MAVRFTAVRRVVGTSSMARAALVALAIMPGGPAFQQALAAPANREPVESRSVLVHPTGTAAVRMPPGARIVSDRRVDEPAPVSGGPGIPGEPIGPGVIPGDAPPDGGTIVSDGAQVPAGQFDRYEQQPGGSMVADGGQGTGPESWGEGAIGSDGVPAGGGPAACGDAACGGDCGMCRGVAGLDPAWQYNANCEPPGLLQRLHGLCRPATGCWTGRADALILSRNAPAFRPLYTLGAGGPVALDADQLESIAAAGPRVSLFQRDHCDTSWEGTYIYSGSFVSERSLLPLGGSYQMAAPGIFGVTSSAGIDTATARLTASLQSVELNRRWNVGPCSQLLAGFRWISWQESLSINDFYDSGVGQDSFSTATFNDLFGGQIGLDTLLWRPSPGFRVEGLVKAGAYYNNASQSSSLVQLSGGVPSNMGYVNVGSSPAVCAFAGEVGITGVVPVHRCVDFRFGYFGLWLASIAQPAAQLSGQNLSQSTPVPTSSLVTNGNVILQGLSLGLEGRW